MTDEIKTLLKSSLPKNFEAKVREKLQKNYSDSHIRNIRNGSRKNDEVLDALVEIAHDYKAKVLEREQKIKELQ